MNAEMLIVDGMSVLPTGFAGLRGYTCIRPGVKLGLLDGLSPADFISAIAAVFVDHDTKAANDDSVRTKRKRPVKNRSRK